MEGIWNITNEDYGDGTAIHNLQLCITDKTEPIWNKVIL